jgi:hypothetical protein
MSDTTSQVRVAAPRATPPVEPCRAHGIDDVLTERGNRYGEFDEHARITQNLKEAMVDSPRWEELSPAMKESLEMIQHKIGRILNGDPTYQDSWTDIIGYARLVEKTLKP